MSKIWFSYQNVKYVIQDLIKALHEELVFHSYGNSGNAIMCCMEFSSAIPSCFDLEMSSSGSWRKGLNVIIRPSNSNTFRTKKTSWSPASYITSPWSFTIRKISFQLVTGIRFNPISFGTFSYSGSSKPFGLSKSLTL